MATAAIHTEAKAVVRARKVCVVMLLLPIWRPTCPGRMRIGNPQIVEQGSADFPEFPTILRRRFRTRRNSVDERKMCYFNILLHIRGQNQRSPWPRALHDNGPLAML